MEKEILDVIVVGAGPAGLSTSYYLKKNGLHHLVFERGKAGESWHSQRWNSFRLNSPNRLNEMPGNEYFQQNTEGFSSSAEFVASLENYIHKFELPIIENALVRSIEKKKNAKLFSVEVFINDAVKTFQSGNVVIASGCQSEIKLPLVAKEVPASVYQLHAGAYRNAAQLPDGNVLVVGSAQSGCQIVEDLLDAGRKVFLSTSRVPRIPRNYRGRDIHDWLLEMKFFDTRKEEVTDPALLHMRSPQLTGVGGQPKTISLQSLAKKGACIVGRMKAINGEEALLESNADLHVRFADGFSGKVKSMIDDWVMKKGIATLPAVVDEEDLPDVNAECATNAGSISLRDENIKTIIWATGFHCDAAYLKLPVWGSEGAPLQKAGVSEVPGLYFVGFHWLRNRKSALICGIVEDAKFIVEKIKERTFDREKELV